MFKERLTIIYSEEGLYHREELSISSIDKYIKEQDIELLNLVLSLRGSNVIGKQSTLETNLYLKYKIRLLYLLSLEHFRPDHLYHRL